MTPIALVRVTFGSAHEAERIAALVVEERLAACVTLTAGRSIYRWEGKVARDDEVVALCKTAPGRTAALVARVAELHSYDLPAIAVVNGEAAAAVAGWIAEATS